MSPCPAQPPTQLSTNPCFAAHQPAQHLQRQSYPTTNCFGGQRAALEIRKFKSNNSFTWRRGGRPRHYSLLGKVFVLLIKLIYSAFHKHQNIPPTQESKRFQLMICEVAFDKVLDCVPRASPARPRRMPTGRLAPNMPSDSNSARQAQP